MRGKPQETPPPRSVSAEPAVEEPAPPDVTSPEAAPPARSRWGIVTAAVVALIVVTGALAATPYWAPAVMQVLPWGNPPPGPVPAPAPAAPPTALDDALAARVAALEAAQAKSDQNAAAMQALGQRIAALEAAQGKSDQSAAAAQSLGQRIAALEARPGTDLTPLQNQLASLAAAVSDLTQKVAALDKAAQAAPAEGTALALLLLQIREAADVGRPFDAEYQALIALSRAHPDIAAAAAPLAEPAKSGVASRAVLSARLHQLAPQIAEASAPAKSSWRAQVLARLRSLVTIRRTDGAGQSPAEAAVSNAERALAGGDLNAAIDDLSGLGGANLAAAEPWLGMARTRLGVETALRQIETLVAAELGGAPAAPAKSG